MGTIIKLKRRRSPSTTGRKNKIRQLPFVSERKRAKRGEPPLCYWSTNFTGADAEFQKECEQGSAYAWLALEAMATENFSPLLGRIALDMARDPVRNRSAIVGFMGVIAQCALLGVKQSAREAVQS
jgi:hypothetical protein